MKNFLLIFDPCLANVSFKKEETILGDCGFTVSYTTDIRPIIESSCKTGAGPGTGCHDAWIDDYSQIKTQLDNGSQDRVFTQMNMPMMPNGSGIDSLTTNELEVMQCWIDQGYPEN
jgi:hypothetical protein